MSNYASSKTKISQDEMLDFKKCLLNILIDLDIFLKDKGIKYSLSAGTMLGAVRHHGFIPWDDDIDIILPKQEYEKLVGCIKEFNPTKYEVILPFDESPLANPRIIKVYLKNTCIKEYGVAYYEGVFLDIFGTLDVDEKKVSSSMKKYRAYTTMLMLKNKRIELSNAPTKTTRILNFLSHFYTKKRLRNNIARYYNYHNDGEYCCSSFGLSTLYKKEWLKEYVQCEFEGHKFPIYKNYHELLKRAFGDYMLPPPEEERNPSHLEFISFNESYKDKNLKLIGFKR